jgi:TM2 domain-containing membrane protein YozV
LVGYTGADRFYLSYTPMGVAKLVLFIVSVSLLVLWLITTKRFHYEKMIGKRRKVAFMSLIFFQYTGTTIFIGLMIWYLVDFAQICDILDPNMPYGQQCAMCWFI